MNTVIVWLRRDLRLLDNPALTAAADTAERVIPVFLWTPADEDPWSPGAAQRWWLHVSLGELDAQLRQLGSQLILGRGEALRELRRIVAATGAEGVYWNRLYDPAIVERDRRVKNALREDGIEARSFNASLLYEPWTVATAQGKPYRVFTQFWRTCQKQSDPPTPLSAPDHLTLASPPESLRLDALELLPRIRWYEGMARAWQPGEKAAQTRLDEFLDDALCGYAEQRDRPDVDGTSRLSPYLHFGELSPRAAWHAVASAGTRSALAQGAAAFTRELGWREFAHHVLFHFPHTTDEPLNERFRLFPWREDSDALLDAWQKGQTGFPIVDAGMRQLWQTGWMHNRVRMIVASLLVKNLRVDWRAGARWFWDTLVDADLANNTLGWQWSAGCGADAAPYFRIFNPVLQGERFDADGAYVRRYVPELAGLPDKAVHKPWTLPHGGRDAGGFRLGADYPAPIVDLKTSREEALAALRSLKEG